MKNLVAMLATGIVLMSPTMSASALEYEVVKGDTLWEIAQEHDTSVESLLEINNLRSDMIFPKQKLEVYEKHLVEKGDTLYAISKKYGVRVEELKTWNELDSDLILVGQELEIREEQVEEVAVTQAIKTTDSSTVTNKVEKPEGRTLTVVATAYTAECEGCSGITYTGINLNKDRNAKVIAVDPTVIPLGSKVYVEGYGYAIAGDIGGAIKGNRIDIHLPTEQEALNWGVKEVKVTIVE
ncbi:LysM peptidoglycan-binding domain-containing protein [Ornithinibacillus bavariensis]|uniref:3D domain-containing protein n=1 Tax=Ornithinibacillus bavariensis TaxID=545502 RepID=UPI000EB9C680|nr:cell wall-binding protein [Ornithinibacillus sp.]